MRRHLCLPALGLAVLASGAAAEDVQDAHFTVGGFAEGVFTGEKDHAASDPTTQVDPNDPSLAFSTQDKLRFVGWVGKQIEVRVEPLYQRSSSKDASGGLILDQAFINYTFNVDDPTWSWTLGKFSTYLGWVAHDADRLWRVNPGPIQGLYGSDLTGTAIAYTPSDAFALSLFLVNGFEFGRSLHGLQAATGLGGALSTAFANDESTAGRSSDRLGVGLDCDVQEIPPHGDKPAWSVDIQGAADLQGSANAQTVGGVTDTSGNAYHVEMFATLHPPRLPHWTLGAELIYQDLGSDSDGVVGSTRNLAGMVMANRIIANAHPFPMSITAMYQHVTYDWRGDRLSPSSINQNETSLALLTNPTHDAHFGVNLEVFYDWFSGQHQRLDGSPAGFYGAALEAIAVIP